MTNDPCRPGAGLSRRSLLAAPLVIAPLGDAGAQAGGLKIVVPFSAGTNLDAMARRLAEVAAPLFGERPTIVNRDGAGGTLAFAELAQRDADGSTFLFSSVGPLTIHPHLGREPRIDLAAFRPVCQIFEQYLVLVASRRLGVDGLDAFLAEARRRPGELKIGHYGPGSVTHIELFAFSRASGIRVIEVPYRAHGQLMMDLASGALDAAFTVPGTFDPSVLPPVALVADEPIALYPALKTTAQLVGHRPSARIIGGLVAHSGTPAPVIERVQAIFRTAFDDQAFQAMATRMGARTQFVDSTHFAALIGEESTRVRALLTEIGLIAQ